MESAEAIRNIRPWRRGSTSLPRLFRLGLDLLAFADDFDRPVAAVLADLSKEFVLSFNLDQHLALERFFRGDHVADLQRKQFIEFDRRLRQKRASLDRRVAHIGPELAKMILLPAFALIAEPVLSRQHS